MTKEQKIAIAMNVVFGSLSIYGTFMLFAVMAWANKGNSGVAILLGTILLFAAALVSLFKLTKGAKRFLWVYSILILFAFPFGTIAGVYTLYFLRTTESQKE